MKGLITHFHDRWKRRINIIHIYYTLLPRNVFRLQILLALHAKANFATNHEIPNIYKCLLRFQTHDTLSPRSSSRRDRLISAMRAFIRSHSWKATTTYGVRSSGSTFAITSCSGNSSGNFSMTSSSAVLICKAQLTP